MSQDVVSFVVRFIRDSDDADNIRWRGVIKHVQGDAETHFTQFSEALAFMQAHVDEVIRTAFDQSAPPKTNPFLETARLWEDLMPKYTQQWLETMKDWASPPPDLTAAWLKQVEQAMSFWSGTAVDKRGNIADTAEIEAEIEELRERLAQLEKILRKTQSSSDTQSA